MSRADAIAAAVLAAFDKLPSNRKPAIRTNGVHEWVPLSGIVAEFDQGGLVCLSLATGMKCLPASGLPLSKGVGIHDWHAEVLALRAFNHFVLQECQDVLLHGHSSPFLKFPQERNMDRMLAPNTEDFKDGAINTHYQRPLEWSSDVTLHMYCSEAPCGDASMELTMSAQDDASPWTIPKGAANTGEGPDQPHRQLPGRGFFSRLGAVRRKPGRGDAPLTLSKSCSDKLALRQCTTVLSGLASLFIAPSSNLCINLLVMPESQYSEAGCRRCFSTVADLGRMAPVANQTWPGGYAMMPLTVQTTNVEFSYSRRSKQPSSSDVSQSPSPPSASSNMSVVWTARGVNECLVGGVLRGRKAFDPAGASAVSRRRMWELARTLADGVLRSCGEKGAGASGQRQLSEQLQRLFQAKTYAGLKADELLTPRRSVKENVKALALQGWASNEGDDDWGLDVV